VRKFGLILLSATCSFASPIYSVAVLPPPISANLLLGPQMFGINDSGQAVGYANDNEALQAIIATPSGSAFVPLLSGWGDTSAEGINNLGQVVGSGNNGNGSTQQAFVGTASGMTAIPIPTGWGSTFGFGINNLGQVAGYGVNSSDYYQAFIGTASGVTAIPQLSGWSNTTVNGINNLGQVTGSVEDSTTQQAIVGTASGLTLIPLVSGWTLSVGAAINDSGQVAGFGNNGANANDQAFIGTVSGSTAIPLPPGATLSMVFFGSLNASGEVVGYSDAGGWIWDASDGTQLLNLFVPAGWNITDAISISNNGLILAEGSFEGGAAQYVELAPDSPEPAAGLLAGTGLALLAFARRRAKFGRR